MPASDAKSETCSPVLLYGWLASPTSPRLDEPEETGATFEANARLKALYYAARTGLMTVADDSGLVIDGLGGEPGVRSARFVRPDASYAERFAEIERRLAGLPEGARRARFVCAVAVVSDSRVLFEVTRKHRGNNRAVARRPRRLRLRPDLLLPAVQRDPRRGDPRGQEPRVAHRGKAFRAVAEWLRQT